MTVGRVTRVKGKIANMALIPGAWTTHSKVMEVFAVAGGGEYSLVINSPDGNSYVARRYVRFDGPPKAGSVGPGGNPLPSHAAHETPMGGWITLSGVSPEVNATFMSLQLQVNHAEKQAHDASENLNKAISGILLLLNSFASNNQTDLIKDLRSELSATRAREASERALAEKRREEQHDLEMRGRRKVETWKEVVEMLGGAVEKGPDAIKKIAGSFFDAMIEAQKRAAESGLPQPGADGTPPA